MANARLVLAILFFTVFILRAPEDSQGAAAPLSPDQQGYLTELVSQAHLKQLAVSRDWHLLLHDKPTLLGGVVSQADGPAFFLSPNGKTDPEAELAATLEKFFTDQPVGRTGQQAQCAFPDRYQWLKEQLAFDPARLHERTCERLERWLGEINPASVTLIFSAAYMNNPSSMFGHTLLRIDQRGQTTETEMLAYVINYAADPDTDNAVLYALLGMTGGFKGVFTTMPYYMKIQEYSDMENRDIWEYRLDFNETQIRRLLLHAWALGNTWFDYYYFKENCSYHLLSLLEIAEPSLHLTDHFWVWTIPVNTVRLIAAQPGLVTTITYRPSGFTKIRYKRAQLPAPERALFTRLIHNTALVQSEPFRRLPVRQQVVLLDLASDYVYYRQAADPAKRASLIPEQRTLLATRSALKIPSESIDVPPPTGPPEAGHATARAGVSTGLVDNEFFEEVSIRAGYHDLLDDARGYLPTAQIEALSLRLRHYNTTNRNRIEQFTLLNIMSLSPIDALFVNPSWKINASFENVREHVCGNCNEVDLDTGVGAAVESRLLVHQVLYAFAEADANIGNAYDQHYRIGGGATVGLLTDLTRRWKMQLLATYLSYPIGERSSDFRSSLEQRLTLTQNTALRLALNRQDAQDEIMLTLNYYF
jgi:Domain of unknown function (DUF4105)